MKFGEALKCLEAGERIARAEWNGKNQWLCYMPGMTIPAGQVNTRTRRFIPEGDVRIGGYIAIYTAEGILQAGWNASQLDMMADDWVMLNA